MTKRKPIAESCVAAGALGVVMTLVSIAGAVEAPNDGAEADATVARFIKLQEKEPRSVATVVTSMGQAPFPGAEMLRAMSEKQIKALVPKLLEMCERRIPVDWRPGETVVDVPAPYQWRHRAVEVLRTVSGWHGPQFPYDYEGYGPPPPEDKDKRDAERTRKTLAAWKKWWAEHNDEPRSKWLAEQAKKVRATLAKAKQTDAHDIRPILRQAVIAGNRKVAGDVTAAAKSATQRGDWMELVHTGYAQTLAELEAKGAVPALLKAARKANARQLEGKIRGFDRPTATRSEVLRQLTAALNKLTGLDLDPLEPIGPEKYRFVAIKDTATFDRWEEAAKGP